MLVIVFTDHDGREHSHRHGLNVVEDLFCGLEPQVGDQLNITADSHLNSLRKASVPAGLYVLESRRFSGCDGYLHFVPAGVS